MVSLHEGANSRNVPYLLTENQAAHIENAVIADLGVRTQRAGARAFGGRFALPGLLDGYVAADGTEFMLAVWGSIPYNSSGNGGWATTSTTVSLIPGLLHQLVETRYGGDLAFAVATCEEPTNTGVGLAGRSRLWVHDIVTGADTQASLAPRCIANFQNRLFYGEGETVGWSAIGLPADFTSANTLLVEPGVGDQITAIIPARDADPRLWVFKERGIYAFDPRWGSSGAFIPSAADALSTVDSSIRPLTTGTGCIATKSAQWVPGEEAADVFFLSFEGIRSLKRAQNDVQSGAGFPVSYNIPGWIDRITWAYAHKAVAAVFDNAYHIAVPMDGAKDNNYVLRYDIQGKAWSLHTWQSRDLSTFALGGQHRIFELNNFTSIDSSVTAAASDPAYQVYQLYSGDYDPSTSISQPVVPIYREESRGFTLKEPLIRKRFGRMTFQLSSEDTSYVNVGYRIDQGHWNTITDTIISGTRETVVLAEDQLPWTEQDEVLRRRTLSLSDYRPAYCLQISIGNVTGCTEIGRISVYMEQISGHVLNDEFVNDE